MTKKIFKVELDIDDIDTRCEFHEKELKDALWNLENNSDFRFDNINVEEIDE